MDELAKIIETEAAGIAKAIGMPKIKTTTFDEEIKKNTKKRKFRTRVFAIIDDISAEEYANFINYLLENNKETNILREAENWTKDGELIRVVDYIEYE